MLHHHIELTLLEYFGPDFRLQSVVAMGGGSINQAARLDTNYGRFFIKWNTSNRWKNWFEIETKSLNLLIAKCSLHIPKVIYFSDAAPHSFLLMEFVESAPAEAPFWEPFAEGLARLHRNSADQFGLNFDNYIGSLPQSNKMHRDWISFFIEERILPQAKRAVDTHLLDLNHMRKFERLFIKLGNIFPVEKPSLLHGDLWSGNFMSTKQGNACIFDPAVYYGSRMMDIGMSRMFGGFHPDFYRFYNQAFPMENNWEEQIDVCNLYPYLVHLNMFGLSYLGGITAVLKKF